MSNLVSRLEDIPGVEAVTVDLTEEGGGINIKLTPGADESEVMERLRSVLIAYGVRSARPEMGSDGDEAPAEQPGPAEQFGVHVTITPMQDGARIEAQSKSVRSFRVVAATPMAIAQGVAEAWSQVVGKVPVEIVGVRVDDGQTLVVTARDGETESIGSAPVEIGWESALTLAVGRAIGTVTVGGPGVLPTRQTDSANY
jgi:hypothetical protein